VGGEATNCRSSEIHIEHIDAGFDQVDHVTRVWATVRSFLNFFNEATSHALAVGLVQRQGKIDAVHDGVIGTDALANLFDHVKAKILPVGKSAQFTVVEGRVGHLFEQIAFVPMEINTVNQGALPSAAACPAALMMIRIPDSSADGRDTRNVKVGIPRGRYGHLELGQERFGRADTSQSSRELNEEARTVSMHGLGQVAPTE